MSQETTDTAQPACRKTTGWRAQFAQPAGWRGWIIGQLMAIKNKERSLWVLSLIDPHPDDRILEIGFGSGADIARIAAQTPSGFVAGIDHSEVMVRQASKRNEKLIRAGRVELRQGSASRLPYESDSFHVAYAINVAQFWTTPTDMVREVRRVLKPGGRIVLAVQPRNKGATEETAQQVGRMLVDALAATGFTSVRIECRRMKPVSTVCALGVK